jgi:methanogenic corrinoid protein MtbC1
MVAKPMTSFDTGAAAQGRGRHARTSLLLEQTLEHALGAWGRHGDPAGAAAGAQPTPRPRSGATPPAAITLPPALLADPELDAPPGRHAALLADTIENEIVPRLVITHDPLLVLHAAPEPEDSACFPDVGTPDVGTLVAQALANDVEGAIATTQALHGQGIALERLYLGLLAPAARELGARWEDDTVDFTQVTSALLCLHHVLRAFSPAFQAEAARGADGRRALLAPVPGEQHIFGLAMVAEFMRRAGWDAWCEPAASAEDLAGMLAREWFAVIGFSVSAETNLETLAGVIRTMRRASRNQALGVLVGGRVFVERPELVGLVGADATAADARHAALQAETLRKLMATRQAPHAPVATAAR